MPDLTYIIGDFDPDARTVRVKFTAGEIVHRRDVNAVLDDAGEYDADGTAERVEEVAQGVAHKIALGVITNPPAEEDPTPAE